jgi:thymidylate kinase
MLTYHPDNNLFDENRICNHYFWEFNWITPSKVILLERDPELSIANYDLNDKQEKQFLLEDSITKHKKKFKNLFEYLKNTQSLTTALYNIQNSRSLDDLKKCIFNILDGEENG